MSGGEPQIRTLMAGERVQLLTDAGDIARGRTGLILAVYPPGDLTMFPGTNRETLYYIRMDMPRKSGTREYYAYWWEVVPLEEKTP